MDIFRALLNVTEDVTSPFQCIINTTNLYGYAIYGVLGVMSNHSVNTAILPGR